MDTTSGRLLISDVDVDIVAATAAHVYHNGRDDRHPQHHPGVGAAGGSKSGGRAPWPQVAACGDPQRGALRHRQTATGLVIGRCNGKGLHEQQNPFPSPVGTTLPTPRQRRDLSVARGTSHEHRVRSVRNCLRQHRPLVWSARRSPLRDLGGRPELRGERADSDDAGVTANSDGVVRWDVVFRSPLRTLNRADRITSRSATPTTKEGRIASMVRALKISCASNRELSVAEATSWP